MTALRRSTMGPKSASAILFGLTKDNKTLGMWIIHRWNDIEIGNVKCILFLCVRTLTELCASVIYPMKLYAHVCVWTLRYWISELFHFKLFMKSYENKCVWIMCIIRHFWSWFWMLTLCMSNTTFRSKLQCNCCLSYTSNFKVLFLFHFYVVRFLRFYI